jgi:hypothetical protein
MQEITNNTGNPPSSLPIYEQLFSFIDDVLYDFQPLSTTNTGNVVTSEDDLTQDLVAYFEDKQEFPKHTIAYSFKFENQSKQGKSKTDIGVRLGRKYLANNRGGYFVGLKPNVYPLPKKRTETNENTYLLVRKRKMEKENSTGMVEFNGLKKVSMLLIYHIHL